MMDVIFRGVDLVADSLATLIPYEPLYSQKYQFLSRALLGLVLLAPLCSTMGTHIVSQRLAFFSEAIGHSAFTGVALGFLWTVLSTNGAVDSPNAVGPAMIFFGIVVACSITAYRRSTNLPTDTIIGVFSATVIAAGLAIITYLVQTGKVRGQWVYQYFLTGNILTLTEGHLAALAAFVVVVLCLEVFHFNRMTLIGINAELAQTRGVWVAWYEYLFSGLLAVVVMFAIQAVGILLVTAMLVIPAASARNYARTAGGAFWCAAGISLASGVGGLVLSDVLGTATGATVILCMTLCFAISSAMGRLMGR